MRSFISKAVSAAFFTLVLAMPVRAHFIWLVPQKSDDGKTKIHVYFGEDGADTGSGFLSYVKGVKLHAVSGAGQPSELPLTITEESVSTLAAFDGKSIVVTSHDLGVIDRGDSVFRLQYYAKAGPSLTDPAWRKAKTSDDLFLDMVPTMKDGSIRVKVLFGGKPVEKAQVIATRPGMEDFEGRTNAKGIVTFDISESGLHSIRARHIEDKSGEFNGKKYPETRHYCTVAVEASTAGSPVAVYDLQNLPQPVTSFGAAVVGGGVYMYGGHTGSAHSYSTEEQSNELTRLDLKSGKWSTIIDGPHLQGLALVTHGGLLYRIGGFTAENAEGEEHHLVSQQSVACFDPAGDRWTELPSLPAGRSSHDAAVVGDCIYVVGGWRMNGPEEKEWHSTALKMDLTAEEKSWEVIAAPPFQRRALATAAHDGKLYVVGGMQKVGGPTTAVAVYDPANDSWAEAPSLFVKTADASNEDGPSTGRMSAGAMAGFGASAFATGGSLYVTTVQGNLQRLSADGATWEVVAEDITPRFFHRLLPLDENHLIVVGGSNMSIGKFDEVEVIDVRTGT